MAIDTAQKRMSAVHVASPWRGAMVDPTESGFTQGNRQAAAFMYSGILASGGAPAEEAVRFVGFMSDIGRFMG